MQAKRRDPSRQKPQWQHVDLPAPELPEIPTKTVNLNKARSQTLNGRRKYVCLDCNETQMVHWTERARRSRARCQSCGSYHLEPCSAGAVLELQRESGNAHGENPTVKKTGT